MHFATTYNKAYLGRPLWIWLAMLLLVCISYSHAQVRVPFQQRASHYTPEKLVYHVKGDFTMIGNTNLTLQNYGHMTQNGSNSMIYVDVDSPTMMGLGGTPTLNSSAATLQYSTENGSVPQCSNVVYAGLYWTGRAHNFAPSNNTFTVTKSGNTKNFDKQKVQFKGPNASQYTEFTAAPNNIYYPTNSDEFMYSAYVEVTDYVRTNGIGEYMVADIALSTGNGGGTGFYGGWGLIVVYENSQMNYRDITIFDGHAFVVAGIASFDIPVAGFNTKQSGNVGVKMGMIAGEGDSGISGDYFKIQKLNSTNFQDLNHTLNTTTNFFNSTIETGGNARNPYLLNNTGLDISMFNIPNPNNSVIGNNQTSTKFKYGTSGDTYIIFAVAMAVDAYIPEAEGIITVESINGQTAINQPYVAQPNQTIKLKVKVRNKGSEAINNSIIKIPLPSNVTYVTNSGNGTINFAPYSGPNSVTYESGSLLWNIGSLPVQANENTILAEMTFEVKVTDNCMQLSSSGCGNNIAISGAINGIGAITNVPLVDVSLIRGYATSGVCVGNTLSGPIFIGIDAAAFVTQHCGGTNQVNNFSFCQPGSTIPVTAISSSFPLGTLFYNQYPVVNGITIQYSATNPFPLTSTPITYFGVPPGSNGCVYSFSISTANVTSAPTPYDVNYSVGATAVPLTATATNAGYNLYYFTSQNSTAQTSIIPSTQVVGQTTYYVAEGPSASCLGPLVPLIVTVSPLGTVSAPANATIYGCGLLALTQLVYSPTSTTITLAQFTAAGGIATSSGSACVFTIRYIDTKVGTCPITVNRTFTISDTCGHNVAVQQQIIIGNNTAPVFNAIPQPQTISCGSPIVFVNALATDDCDGVIQPTFIDTTVNGACAGMYSVTRTWTAIDSCGNIATVFQTINVQDFQGPVITTPAQNLTLQCGAGTNTALTQWLQNHGGAIASDACSDVTWTNNFDNLVMNCAAPIAVTFTATDACGNSTQTIATVVSDDNLAPTPPIAPSNITVACASDVPSPLQLTALDNCQGNIVATSVDTINPGMCASIFSILRTWTFADACGNSSQIFQTINIENTSPLTFNESLPVDLTLECSAIPTAVILTVRSSCGQSVQVLYTEEIVAGTCPIYSKITRTWKAFDGCGNHIQHVQIINLTDSTAPTLVGMLEENLAATCNQIPAIPNLQFTDSCGTVSNVAFTENLTNYTGQTYDIVRTWIVEDSCQNSSTFLQTVTVTEKIQNSTASGYAACNSDISLTIDLLSLLPAGMATDGQFIDFNNTGALSGSTFIPNGLQKGDYEIQYESLASDCPALVQIKITVDDDCMVIPACSLMVHNAITPNDDGFNDLFYIENIDNTFCFPTNKVEIYNRWGTMVYETKQYNNSDRSFRGLSEGKVTVNKSDELPTGTYFYILEYTNASGEVMKKDGYLYLSR